LSAGRLKIRVLKDESLRAPVQSAPSPSVPNSGLGMTSRSREKGMISRQFEIKTAELISHFRIHFVRVCPAKMRYLKKKIGRYLDVDLNGFLLMATAET
ncbi:hypothetical protein XENORESO_005917, partial [Xenotaenia resolanae]